MILTCPNCSVRYLLDAQVLAPDGRLVRCSACQNVWHQEPDEDFEEFDTPKAASGDDDFEFVPAGVRPQPGDFDGPILSGNANLMPIVTGIAAASFLFLALATVLAMSRNTVVDAWPPSALLFETLGFEMSVPGEELIFDRVKAETAWDERGNEILYVEGRIINRYERDVALPRMVASSLDAGGKPVAQWVVPPPVPGLAAEQNLTFSTSYPVGNGDVRQVRVSMVMPDIRTDATGGGNSPVPSPGGKNRPIADAGSAKSPPAAPDPAHPESGH
ncbi:MAG: hypothetical protein EOM26_03245 [Alphaproteobacteria bacterium]|nr:hypothetical protein [Alphaproteobacteria bacterium]